MNEPTLTLHESRGVDDGSRGNRSLFVSIHLGILVALGSIVALVALVALTALATLAAVAPAGKNALEQRGTAATLATLLAATVFAAVFLAATLERNSEV